MPKLTLLDMVQDIMSDMNSDEVNSINDTSESLQVAQIIKTTYFELMDNREWPHLKELVQLTPSGDSAKPTHMSLDDTFQYLESISYDKHIVGESDVKYMEISYLEPDAFLRMMNARRSTNDNIDEIVDDSGITLMVKNDEHPTYWTSFDDENIIFDSYLSTLDSTLQQSKTQALAYKEASWTVDDTFIPDLPAKNFSMLLAEAKSTCFNSLKQVVNQKEEQKSSRQKVWSARKKWRENGGIKFPNYGRK